MSRRVAASILVLAGLAASAHAADPTTDPALKVKVGEPAPELTIEEWIDAPAADSKDGITMESLAGKVVVLEFWGPFCAPCIAAFPHINELKASFADELVVFISVADQGSSSCQRVLTKHDLDTWKAFDHDTSLFDAYGVYAMPRTVVIGKDGNVMAYTEPMLLDADVIKAALAGKPLESHYKASQFKAGG